MLRARQRVPRAGDRPQPAPHVRPMRHANVILVLLLGRWTPAEVEAQARTCRDAPAGRGHCSCFVLGVQP
jgi:hypothetical protein